MWRRTTQGDQCQTFPDNVVVSSFSARRSNSSLDMTVYKSSNFIIGRYDPKVSLWDRLSEDGPRTKFNQNTSKTVTLVTRTRVWRESRDDDVDADVDIVIKNNTRKTFWCQVHPFSDRRFKIKQSCSQRFCDVELKNKRTVANEKSGLGGGALERANNCTSNWPQLTLIGWNSFRVGYEPVNRYIDILSKQQYRNITPDITNCYF